jgi:hypothetical protein
VFKAQRLRKLLGQYSGQATPKFGHFTQLSIQVSPQVVAARYASLPEIRLIELNARGDFISGQPFLGQVHKVQVDFRHCSEKKDSKNEFVGQCTH